MRLTQKSINEYYLLPFKFERLDSNTELLVNEVGDYLLLPTGTTNRLVHRSLIAKKDFELYNKLLTNFFITESLPPEYLRIIETRYATKKSFMDPFTSLHIIVLTLRCNQDCQYCQVSKVRKNSMKKRYDMTTETLHKTIDFIFASPSTDITIEFQGGEPLLRFDLIKDAIKYSNKINKKYNKNITYVICTNLSYADKNILKFCKDHNVLISTSLDGPEYIHNKNRHNELFNAHQRTIEKISLAREIVGKENVSALMTTSKLSLDYPREIVDEYIKHDFKEIFLRELNPYGGAIQNRKQLAYSSNEFFEFYKVALNRVVEYNLKGIAMVEVFTQFLLKKILSPFPIGFVDLQTPAGLLINVLLYNYDGAIYPSDEARMLSEMGDDKFYLGNVDSEYKKIFMSETIEQITSAWATEYSYGCSECAFQSYCGIDPIRNYQLYGDLHGFRPSNEHCHKMKKLFTYLIQRIESEQEFKSLAYSWISN